MDKSLWRPLVAAPALLLIGLAACSGDDEDALDATPSSAVSEQDGSSATGDDGRDGGDEDEGDDGGNGGRRGDPLGTTTGQQPADPGDSSLVPLRIDVTGLERNRDLVELYMTLTNESDTADLTFEPWGQFGADSPSGTYDLAGISLVDQAAQKLYLPVLDSEGTCLCTGDLVHVAIPPGESVDLEATFGGIPSDAESLDLHVPGFDPVTGLEVG